MSETDISTAAVIALLDGVTAGPWRLRPDDEAGEPAQCIKSRNFDIATCWGGYIAGDSDAEFIAAPRDLVPALLADRDRLAAEVARLTAERDAAMAGRVKVKPLVWEYASEGGRIQEAVGFNAVYKIWDGADGIVRWQKRHMAHWIVAASVDAAKAAIQADYSDDVAAAIQPDTERAEPVACPDCCEICGGRTFAQAACKTGWRCIECKTVYTTPQPAPAPQAREITVQEAADVPEVKALMVAAHNMLHDIGELVANSEGVAGLHMNGDVADWESLLPGGSFGAWLHGVEVLRTTLAATQKKG